MHRHQIESHCAPFLKWAGGKRWLAPLLASLVDPRRDYFEPFLGGGAVFFAVNPERGHLSDRNQELIATYRGIRRHAESICATLQQMPIGKKVYERMIGMNALSIKARAVRLIYLNRAAFNGIYRVNRRNQFNVPFGCKPGTTSCDAPAIERCANRLRGATIQCLDFREALSATKRASTIYADPPYTTKDLNGSFRRYNEHLFSWRDQIDLAEVLSEKAAGGDTVLVSNAMTKDILRLYPKDLFIVLEVKRRSAVAADAASRSLVSEALILSKGTIQDRRHLCRLRREYPSVIARVRRGPL